MIQPSLDISNKIVFIYKIRSSNDVALLNPRFEIHFDRVFLVGVVPDGGSASDWLSGLTTYVAWDEVEEFVIFDSLEEYYSRLSRTWSNATMQ